MAISANLTNEQRKAIYRRDGYRCALCDSARYIQIHHIIPRGQGGSNHPYNLICLCSDCHAMAHGMNLRGWVDMDEERIELAICEYMADLYPSFWNCYASDKHPVAPTWEEMGKNGYPQV